MTDQKLTTEYVEGVEIAGPSAVERRVMHGAAIQFQRRADSLGLKGVKLAQQMEAFYEGAIHVAVNVNAMTAERAGIVNFMCAVGRLAELHKSWLAVE